MGVQLQDANITITIYLDPPPLSRAGFGTVLFATPNVGVGFPATGVKSYASAAEVAADKLLGTVIDDVVADALTNAFSQTPRPSRIKVGKVTGGGGGPDIGDIATDLSTIETADSDWYGLALDLSGEASSADRATVIAAAAGWAEARTKIMAVQSEEADIIAAGGGVAKTLKDLARERTAVVFYKLVAAAEVQVALSWICRILAFDPDDQSATWESPLAGVTASDLTSAERTFALGHNANAIVPYGSVAAFLDPGKNCNGRALYEVLTADWFEARTREDFAAAKTKLAASGRKFPLSEEGQAIGKAILDSWGRQGIAAEHFQSVAPAEAEAITATDRSALKLRFKFYGQILGSARVFEVGVVLSRDPVVTEA